MAEQSLTPEQVTAFYTKLGYTLDEASKKAAEFFRSTKGSAAELGEEFRKIKDAVGAVKEGAAETSESFEKLKKEIGDLAGKAAPAAILAGSTYLMKAKEDFASLDDYTTRGVAGFNTLMHNYDVLKESVKSGDFSSLVSGGVITEELKDEFQRKAGKDESKLRQMGEAAVEFAKQQEILTQSILTQAGQAGTLDEVFEKTDGFRNMAQYAAEANQKITSIAGSLGLTRSEVVKYYEEINKVPGAMDQVVKIVGSDSDTLLGAMVTLSRGARIQMSDLKDILSDLRNNFNMTFGADEDSSGAEALEFMASMSRASQGLDLDFSTLKGQISNLASSFSMYGNTSKDLLSSFYEVAKGLEATGLSAKSSGEMAQSYIRHFGELSMAQKSYISQMSGGPGGLMGAFQIERDLREGNFESVFRKFQTTIQRNVGPIVSQEEAETSESAASKRLMQMQMLRGGPLGSLVKDEASAGRLLDAMAASAKGTESLQTASESLKEIYASGKERQKAESTRATAVESQFNQIRSLAEIIAYNTTKMAFEKVSLIRDDAEAQREMDIISEVSKRRAVETRVGGTVLNPEDGQEVLVRKGLSDLGESTSAMLRSAKLDFLAIKEKVEKYVSGIEGDKKDTAQSYLTSLGGEFTPEALARSGDVVEYQRAQRSFANLLEALPKDKLPNLDEIIVGARDRAAEVAATSAKADKAAKSAEPERSHPASMVPVKRDSGTLEILCAGCLKELVLKEIDRGHAKAVSGRSP